MPSQSDYGCSDYRTEMILVGLRTRLQQDNLTDEERRKLENELNDLEKDFYG
jgi:hypothetical protein